MQVISINEMKQVLTHIMLGENEPVGLLGQFGAGKTDGVEQWTEEHDVFMCKVLLGQYDTVDLKGTPWIHTFTANVAGDLGIETEIEFKATVWHPAATLPFRGNPNFPTDRPIILFLDEITSASIPVMAVCYQLINERRIGEHVLMDNVYIACAGNREIDKGVVNRMPKPLENRITWFEIGVELQGWSTWASRKYGTDAAMIIAFLNWKKEYLCTYDPNKAERVNATPRTWEKAIKYFRKETIPDSIKEAAISGAVGQGVTTDLWAFKNVYHEISALMPLIRKDPMKAPIPDEMSKQYAIAVACSGEMTMKDNVSRKAFAAYLMRMTAEFTVLGWQLAVNREDPLFECDEFVKFSSKYTVVFDSSK